MLSSIAHAGMAFTAIPAPTLYHDLLTADSFNQEDGMSKAKITRRACNYKFYISTGYLPKATPQSRVYPLQQEVGGNRAD